MMVDIDAIIQILTESLEPIKTIRTYSKKPGIYAIGFVGEEFPLSEDSLYLEERPLLYIGKSERSSFKRDKKTHFSSGKTGSSTVRRSLGALLREQLSLTPIPRSPFREGDSEEQKRRKCAQYKFAQGGEGRLTRWMVENLSLSYWEHDGDVDKLKRLEKQIISYYTPLLNIRVNPDNPFKGTLKKSREECKLLAMRKASL